MTNKIKLIIFSFLAIFSIFSTASAVEFYWDIRTEEVVGEYNWYNMDYQENSFNYLWCIVKRYASQASLKTTKFCDDWMYVMHSTSAYISVLMGSSYWFRSEGGFVAWKKDDSSNIFSFKVLNEEGKKKFYRFWIKNVWGKSVKLNSKRGSAVYNSAFMDGIWFVLTKRDWDQVKVSHVIDNVFALDGFLVVARDWDSYLIDTYTNKMYKYNNGLFPMNRYAKGEVESIFPKIWDNVPSEVSDVQRVPLGDYKMYYNQNEYKSFDLKNTREATEADLNEIRENIKKSLVVFNQDALKLYRDVDWLDLSVGDSSDLPNNTNSNNTKNNSVEEKKSCVEYYTYMRSMSSHSDWCLWEVNKDMSDTRLDYWWAISTDWDLSKFGVWDKTKYRRCWHWNNYKEGVKKTLWDKWPAFWKDRQTNYIATEAKDIDVNALCSHIVVEKSFEKTDPFSFSWMVALWWALRGILDNVWQKVKVWDSEIAVNTLSWDIGRYYTYAQACRDKRYMQTPIDSKLSYIIGYDFFFNSSNNEKVCEYAEILKKNIEKKYWGKEIDKKYRDAMANELEEKWTTWDFKNVFNDKWEIDILKLENSANKTHSNPFKDPEDVLGLRKILWFFQKDFDAWVNLVYTSLSGQRCWEWIWIKEWDYIMRLFVFIIWFVLFKWRN